MGCACSVLASGEDAGFCSRYHEGEGDALCLSALYFHCYALTPVLALASEVADLLLSFAGDADGACLSLELGVEGIEGDRLPGCEELAFEMAGACSLEVNAGEVALADVVNALYLRSCFGPDLLETVVDRARNALSDLTGGELAEQVVQCSECGFGVDVVHPF